MRLFYCYSTKLKRYLVTSGFKYLKADIHPNTDKAYWVFEGTTSLNEHLDKWRLKEH